MILPIFLLFISITGIQSDWVHPDKFGPSSSNSWENQGRSSSCDCGEALTYCRESLQRLQESTKNPDPDCNSRLYLKRFINLFLINLNDDDFPHDITKELSLQIKLTGRDVSILRKFGKDEVHLSEVDHIISNLFHPSWKTVQYLDYVASTFNWVSQILGGLSPLTVAVVGCLFFFIYFLWLIRMMSYRKAFTVLATLIFIVSFGLKWEFKRQENLIKVLMSQNEVLPEECDHTEGFMSWLLHGRDRKNCENYLKTLHIDPVLSISITKVISEVLFDFILHPLSYLLESVMGIVKEFSRGYPPIIGGIVHAIMSIAGLCVIAYIFVKISTAFLQVVGSLIWNSGASSIEKPEFFSFPDMGLKKNKNQIEGNQERPGLLSGSFFSFGSPQPERKEPESTFRPSESAKKNQKKPALLGASNFNFRNPQPEGKESGPTFLPGAVIPQMRSSGDSKGFIFNFGSHQPEGKTAEPIFVPAETSSTSAPLELRKTSHKWNFKAKRKVKDRLK